MEASGPRQINWCGEGEARKAARHCLTLPRQFIWRGPRTPRNPALEASGPRQINWSGEEEARKATRHCLTLPRQLIWRASKTNYAAEHANG